MGGAEMIKKLTLILLTLTVLFSLAACGNKQETVEEIPEYTIVQNMTATDVKKIVNQFIIDIYSPNSQEQIDNALVEFCKIATENEINTLKDEIGEYDEAKKASIKNVSISIAMPKNTENNKMKIVATFDISIRDVRQSMLIEFRCNNDNMIESHSIWVNNG